METRSQIDDAMAAVFATAGEVGEACLELDWASTPLGAPARWPANLRSLVAMAMASRFPLLIWWGPELVMIYNQAYRRIIDRKHPFALGRPGREVFPEIWDLIGPMLHGVIERGEATWSEDQMLLLERAGFLEECYFTFSYSPIRGDDGQVDGIFCAVAEVTDRLIAERRLRTLGVLAERTASATTVAEACELAVGALGDGEGRIPVPFALIYLNGDGGPRLAAATGLQALPGPDTWPLDVDATPAVVALDAARLQPDEPWRLDRPPQSAVVLPLGPGDGVLVCGSNPLRQLDDVYLSFFRLLARTVGTAIDAGRRHEQEQRRLEMLAELDRAKTDFFSNVSHELRTPLTLVLAPVEDLLADPALDDSTRSTLEAVHRNALRLTRLVNTLLDFSLLEAGRLEPHFAAVDLDELTRELASSFLYAAEKAGLELVIDCAGPAEPVAVDPEMWEKIVLNLLTNAFKFTLEGSIRVRLRQDGDEVELIVADTGPGIPEEEIERVFERFHRVRGAQARTFEGSGIGLALVRELVALQGGTVGVASSPAGTVFTVRLPIHREGRTVTAAPAARGTETAAYVQESLRWLSQSAPSASEVATPERAGTVLVVEDNADMRDYLVRILGAHWTVTAADDGAAALESAIAAPPDLVLTDVMMPALDGFGLLRELRAHPVTSAIPVLMLSARAGPEAAIEGLVAGADDYLVKPFTGQELVARVRTNLELARRRSELAAARTESERLSVVDEVQRRFLLLASHELRTPVTILRGYLSMLTDGTLEPGADAVPSALRQMETTVDEVHRVVELMLEVARFEATHTELNPTRVDLGGLVAASVAGIRGDRQSQGRIRLLTEPVAAYVDVDKVRFIVGALVDNALRYSAPETAVTVRVEPGAYGHAVVSVSDEGPGIAPEHQGALFSRFGRIVTTDNAQLAGIGLSLYLARELARLHGGDIDVESAPGAGSTFRVRLPLA